MNSTATQKSMIKGFVYVILSAVMFGTMPLMAKAIYAQGVNSMTLVLLRNCMSLPFLVIAALASGKSLKMSLEDIPSVSCISLVGCCLTPLLLFNSYQYMDTGVATVFHFIYPGIVVLIEFLFFRKKIKGATILSIILCLVGICLFYTPGKPISTKGSIYAFASGVTYATYVVLLANFKRKELSGWVLSFYISLICTVVLLGVCLLTGELMLPASLKGWGLSVLFAIAINVGAVVLFQNGTRIVGGEKASILSTFEPITSVVVGMLVFNEVMGLGTIIGTVLVIAASIFITLFDNKN